MIFYFPQYLFVMYPYSSPDLLSWVLSFGKFAIRLSILLRTIKERTEENHQNTIHKSHKEIIKKYLTKIIIH